MNLQEDVLLQPILVRSLPCLSQDTDVGACNVNKALWVINSIFDEHHELIVRTYTLVAGAASSLVVTTGLFNWDKNRYYTPSVPYKWTKTRGLTKCNVEGRAAATKDAIESTSESEKATSTAANRVRVTARNNLAITARCVASRPNSRPTSLHILRWHGHSRKGEGKESEDCWHLHFDDRLCEYTRVYRDSEEDNKNGRECLNEWLFNGVMMKWKFTDGNYLAFIGLKHSWSSRASGYCILRIQEMLATPLAGIILKVATMAHGLLELTALLFKQSLIVKNLFAKRSLKRVQ